MTQPSQPRFFPSPHDAPRDGLIGVGGKLVTPWLLDAYRHGIFPWPTQDDVLAWWSPDPRAVLEFDQMHVSRRLAQTMRTGKFTVTCDRAFADVMQGCATSQERAVEGTWITPEMYEAYCRLHQEGHTHSVEVWLDGELVGGIYGMAVGAAFSAESMFYRERDASKVALVSLVRHLQARGFTLLDIQQLTPHSQRMGATAIRRKQFLARLAEAVDLAVTFGAELVG